MITIEFFGVPRIRAKTGKWTVQAATLGEALELLAENFPDLVGTILTHEPVSLMPSYRISSSGDHFVSEPKTPLSDGDVLLILSADVGG